MRAPRIGNRGSTLIEAAVALAITGTVVAIAWLLVAYTGRSAIQERLHVLATVELQDLDRALRQGALRVRVPLWHAPDGFLTIQDQTASVAYVDGSPEGVLEVKTDNGVVLTLPDRSLRFRRLEISGMEAAVDQDGLVYGIDLRVTSKGGAESRIVVSFGALPW